MTTYNRYEAAKIANPNEEIFSYGDTYKPKGEPCRPSEWWVKCSPDDHCMTVEQFLMAGHKFVAGDIVLNSGGKVINITNKLVNSEWDSSRCPQDDKRYILRAAALESKMNIDKLETQSEEQPKRVKYDYERVDFVEHWEYFKLMSEEGDLYVHCADLSYEGFGGDNINLANALHDGSCIYRCIETEITERDEFIQEAMKHGASKGALELGELRLVEKMFDSGRYKLVDGE